MILTVTANAAIDKRYVLDSLRTGTVNRVKVCEPSAGGKGINVSRVASILGEDVTATGFLGGHAGKFISGQVERLGIRSEFVWCRGESRSCLNIWNEEKKEQTEILEPGFPVTEEDCGRLLEKYRSLLRGCSVAAISGSVPQGAGSGLYRSMIRAAKEAGKPVLLDTSGRLLQECLEEKPDLIKPNIDEIRSIANREIRGREDLLGAAQELHRSGIGTVVISLGKDGSLVSSADGAYDVKVPEIDAVNSVGCGDSMLAGFAAGIARGLPPEESIRLAAAVSAANAMRRETGFFRMEDMEALLPQIRIRKIS